MSSIEKRVTELEEEVRASHRAAEAAAGRWERLALARLTDEELAALEAMQNGESEGTAWALERWRAVHREVMEEDNGS